jgi:hypothetical protein
MHWKHPISKDYPYITGNATGYSQSSGLRRLKRGLFTAQAYFTPTFTLGEGQKWAPSPSWMCPVCLPQSGFVQQKFTDRPPSLFCSVQLVILASKSLTQNLCRRRLKLALGSETMISGTCIVIKTKKFPILEGEKDGNRSQGNPRL